MRDIFFECAPVYQNVRDKINALREEYRTLKTFPIGKSSQGREISALCIGNPAGATLFVGATHGLEWLTCMLLLRFCQRLLEAMSGNGRISDIDAARAMQSRSLVIIPCLNPDGVEIALCGSAAAGEKAGMVEALSGGDPGRCWQANANGVDLNHNFDAGWSILKEMEINCGITAPAPGRYGGEHPHSEPESIAVTTFCMAYQPRSLYSFHSQGEEIYYHYGENTPLRSRTMAQILASSSGYALGKPAGLASHGGLKDWFIEKFRRPGFTIEVGLGKNPLGIEQLDPIYAKTEEMLILAVLL